MKSLHIIVADKNKCIEVMKSELYKCKKKKHLKQA